MTVLLVLAPAPLAAQLYVPNQDDATVSVIDPATRRLLRTVDLRRYGAADNAKPHHAQVEPDGSAWYVTLIGAGKVLKLDRNGRLLGSVEMEVPGLIALHPSKDLMFVGRSMSAVNPPPRMAVIRRSDMTLLDEVDLLFPRPHGIVVHPRGDVVYVASLGTNQIASVGVERGEVRLLDVPGMAHGFVQAAVSPDGSLLAVTAELTDSLLIFDLADPWMPKPARGLAMPDGPFEPAFTPDGRSIFVTALNANRVAAVDTRRWTVTVLPEHPGFGQPHGIALAPDGSRVFVGNRHQLGGVHDHAGGKPAGAGTVVAICVESRRVDTVLTVGRYAAGLGMTPARPGASAVSRPCR
ncbi:MAG: YncE family protein [Gemmatimonadales bacterium]